MPSPTPAAQLPPFSNMRARCARCGAKYGIIVMFDRGCREVTGEHFHRVCDCGHRWVEQTFEAPRGAIRR